MKDQNEIVTWWRQERGRIRNQLIEKAKTQPLSKVEVIIMNPFTLKQAWNQVCTLNSSVGGCSDSHH